MRFKALVVTAGRLVGQPIVAFSRFHGLRLGTGVRARVWLGLRSRETAEDAGSASGAFGTIPIGVRPPALGWSSLMITSRGLFPHGPIIDKLEQPPLIAD